MRLGVRSTYLGSKHRNRKPMIRAYHSTSQPQCESSRGACISGAHPVPTCQPQLPPTHHQLQQCIMPGGSRSRDGCFNCRKRKRRCDEEKPVCRRCCKTRDDCVFPEPASASNLKFVVAASDHYLVPITTQNTSFLNLSPQELVSICDHFKGRVPLPRTLSPFLFESQGNKVIEQSLVQYCKC